MDDYDSCEAKAERHQQKVQNLEEVHRETMFVVDQDTPLSSVVLPGTYRLKCECVDSRVFLRNARRADLIECLKSVV